MIKNGGFSIIEVIVAISIFSIGVLAIASMQFISVKNLAFSGKNCFGYYSLISEINLLYQKDYNSNELSFGKHKKEYKNHEIEWEVKKASINNNMKEITFFYSYMNGKNRKTLTIYKSK
ncbi:MAG: prepilin-type N-terminal cleavage/methylation domain-containing protein [Deltaproteobacteria bacterium]|nr:prepilin-type N-terminal cleavage/methylation domain-containing protein [Deltaproteobacteria bacterium]